MEELTKTPNEAQAKESGSLQSGVDALVSGLSKSDIRFKIVMGVFFGMAWAAEYQQFGLVLGAIIPTVGAILGIAVGYPLCKWISSGS